MGFFRLLLALMVFNSHYEVFQAKTISGHQAVELFFVVSGFYMSLVLREKYADVKSFYTSRFWRLFPPYWVAAALSLLALATLDVHPLTGWKSYSTAMTEGIAETALLSFSQLFVLGQEWFFGLRFTPGGGFALPENLSGDVWQIMPVIPAWSLSLELMFYLLVPLLARRKLPTLLAVFALALGMHLWALSSGLTETRLANYSFPLNFWLFVAGMLSHRAFERFQPALTRKTLRTTLIGVVAFTLLACGVSGMDHGLLSSRFPLLLACLCLTMPLIFAQVRGSRLDRAVGEFTYPFYLVHYQVIAMLEQCFPDTPEWAYPLWAALAGVVLWWSVMRPISRRRGISGGFGPRLAPAGSL